MVSVPTLIMLITFDARMLHDEDSVSTQGSCLIAFSYQFKTWYYIYSSVCIYLLFSVQLFTLECAFIYSGVCIYLLWSVHLFTLECAFIYSGVCFYLLSSVHLFLWSVHLFTLECAFIYGVCIYLLFSVHLFTLECAFIYSRVCTFFMLLSAMNQCLIAQCVII